MNDHAHVIDVTAANFSEAVLETSERVPVLVDFWASWCGPCKMLMPILEKLAAEYGGQFILAKVNIDEQQELAVQFGVRSVPTVKVVRQGAVVDEFTGAQPESTIRAILDEHVERESDRIIAEAVGTYEKGRVDEALGALRTLMGDEPSNHRAALALAEMLVAADEFKEADALLRGLPADVGASEQVTNLQTRLSMGQTAADAPPAQELEARLTADPKDSEARLQLAVRKAVAGEYEPAMELLLEVLKDPSRREEARTTLLKIFEMVGSGELVKRYRSRMASALM